ncbi:MFS transporter [Pandoraea sp. NPDC087047]|uniref:MFS transporter n=1 Tax=Pandoraea sp. NPDC087047 TaxID=3364390 RepID=UPI003819B876
MSSNRGKSLSRTGVITAITIGNALEFFDFTVYGFLAITIGRLFFPMEDSYSQLLLAVGSFGVGFIMRPIGAVVIGVFADRAGRKRAMTLTVFLMALGCLVIAIAPTYAQVGIGGALMIVAGRLIQGFSAGGEFGASTTLLAEHSTPANRGYMASWQLASQGLGILTGALIVGLLTYSLDSKSMSSWGWRIPFIVGLLIAPIGMYIRRRLNESLHVSQLSRSDETRQKRKGSLHLLLRDHWSTVVFAIFNVIGTTTAAYVTTFYLPTYAIKELHIAPTVALTGAALTGLVTFVLSPIVGRWSDKVGRKRLILVSRLLLIVLVFPAFLWLTEWRTPMALLSVLVILSALLVIQGVPGIVMLPEMFPMHVRATGISVTYSVGVAVFGGFAPLANAWLVSALNTTLAPAWYLGVMTLISLYGLHYLKDHTGTDIDKGNEGAFNRTTAQQEREWNISR